MCFSATASFVASGVLIGGGCYAMAQRPVSKHARLLALMPVIFGIHQFSEGLVWLGINGDVSIEIQNAAMYFFTFVAMCLWPVYIPLALYVYERPKRQFIYLSLLGAGSIISSYLLWCFTAYSELYINVQCCNSIAYFYQLPYLYGIIDYFYVMVVVLPFLFSSNRKIRFLLGPGFLITFFIALLLESGGDYPSIWCFLAAILSIITYYSIYENKSVR